MRVADAVIHTLKHYGVREMFGIPGDAINSLMDGVRRIDDFEFIQVKHEESGAFAAGAQAKLSGQLAACAGTSGPGALHLINGLYDAAMDHAPVVAVTGQVETDVVGSQYHQEANLESLFDEFAVYSRRVSTPEQALSAITDACREAMAKSGVAHVAISSDIADENIDFDPDDLPLIAAAQSVQADMDMLAKVADFLSRPQRTVILAGLGCRHAREELLRLADALAAPIVRTLPAKDFIDDTEALCIGGLGLLGNEPAVAAMEQCDTLLMLGTDFPYASFYPQDAHVIQVDIDAARLGRRHRIETGIQGDCQSVIRALLPMLTNRRDDKFLTSMQQAQRDKTQSDTATPLKPQHVIQRVAAAAPDDAIFVCDTGTVTAWAARHLPIKNGQRFTLSSNLGSMAYALPGAIGAALRYPQRPVIALVGDAGFAMLMQELMTASHYQLPITVVVFNNRKLGLIELEQNVAGYPAFGTDVANPDFSLIAQACAAHGASVDDDQSLQAALGEAIASDRPSVIDVAVNPDEWITPPKIGWQDAVHFGVSKVKEMKEQFLHWR